MSIRPATHDDVDTLVDMGEMLHNESPRWSRIRYSREKVRALVTRLVSEPYGLALVAEKDGQIIGGLIATALPHWSSDDVIAEERSLFMRPEHRGSFSALRLVCAFRCWSELRGAVWADAGSTTGVDPEITARLYEASGFSRCAIGLEAYFGN